MLAYVTLIAAIAALATAELKTAPLSEDKSFMMDWEIKDGNITVEVKGKSTGWVGWGLSPTGDMEGADLMIGWVRNGTVHVYDFHATANTRPILDTDQDYTAISGKEEDGYTTIKFTRKLVTNNAPQDGEVPDIDIEAGKEYNIIWAWNDEKPENDDPEKIKYHGEEAENRGSVKVTL